MASMVEPTLAELQPGAARAEPVMAETTEVVSPPNSVEPVPPAPPTECAPRLEPELDAGGVWEVHRKKQGWTPLAPALQPALDAAMATAAERVELLIDTATRSWVPSSAALDEATRHRCTVYVAFPRESKMGKLGGEPPRPIRRRSGPLEAATEPEEEFQEEEDPLMFTAKPVDGIVINSSIFERLQKGVSERYAGHRYAGDSTAYEQPCVEGAC